MKNLPWVYQPCLPLLLSFFCITVLAQPGPLDTTGLRSFSDKFIIKANFSSQTDTYRYRDRETGDRLELSPNSSLRLFISLDYEFIGASLGFAPSFLSNNRDEELKGTSSFSDYRFRFFLGKWVQGLQYRKVKGFYVENTGDFLPTWQQGTDPYILFPDLASTLYGMSTSYVFNERFSLRNVLYQTEWQQESAGSFIPSLYYDYTIFRLAEEGLQSTDRTLNIKLTPAYYYTLVLHKHWFFSTNVGPAAGIRFSWTRQVDEGVFSSEKATFLPRYLDGGIQLGYSSDRVIFGANFNFAINWYSQRKLYSAENDQLYGLVYFGYRFDAPGFARRTVDWLYRKQP